MNILIMIVLSLFAANGLYQLITGIYGWFN